MSTERMPMRLAAQQCHIALLYGWYNLSPPKKLLFFHSYVHVKHNATHETLKFSNKNTKQYSL